MTSQPTAREVFIAKLAEFDKLMAELDAMRARNFGARAVPDWADVGSLKYACELLREAVEHYDRP
jgi:hypothetical protein